MVLRNSSRCGVAYTPSTTQPEGRSGFREEKCMATSDVLAGKWKQIRGGIKKQWGDLTDDEIDQVRGERDRLAGLLQERYGYAKIKAEREIDEFLLQFSDDSA
jgi:uncharacterized protein YjbJ (UPF0337 family)